MSLGRPNERRLASSRVSSGRPAAAAAKPLRRRRVVTPRPDPGRGRRPRAASSWATRCTSIGPPRDRVVTPTPEENSREIRPRRLAPSTSWVALAPRANVEQRGRDVVAEDLVVAAAHALDEVALAGQVLGARAGQPVAAGDVDGEQVRVLGPGGDAGRAAQQRVALPSAAEGDHDAFPGLPRGRDVVVGAVAVELLVDLVGQPDAARSRAGR